MKGIYVEPSDLDPRVGSAWVKQTVDIPPVFAAGSDDYFCRVMDCFTRIEMRGEARGSRKPLRLFSRNTHSADWRHLRGRRDKSVDPRRLLIAFVSTGCGTPHSNTHDDASYAAEMISARLNGDFRSHWGTWARPVTRAAGTRDRLGIEVGASLDLVVRAAAKAGEEMDWWWAGVIERGALSAAGRSASESWGDDDE